MSRRRLARYSHTQNIDEPLAMLRSATTSYYHADGLGSITSLSSAAGSLAQTYTFDSFGQQTASSGSLTNPFQYTGRELDTETGLYFYRARYFDPATGRFLTEDPIGLGGGLNLYRYAKNQPTRYVDPSGMAPAATSVDAAMEQAITRGNIEEIRFLLESSGDALTPGMRQAAQIAVDNGGVDVGGAKSARELVKHLKYTQQLDVFPIPCPLSAVTTPPNSALSLFLSVCPGASFRSNVNYKIDIDNATFPCYGCACTLPLIPFTPLVSPISSPPNTSPPVISAPH